MRNRFAMLVLSGAMCVGLNSRASAQTADTSTYANLEFVSADMSRRVVVLRNPQGQTATYNLDDTLGSVGPLKPGDKVIVTMRAGVGTVRNGRISAITKAGAPTGRVTVAATPVVGARGTVLIAPANQGARDAFARQVATISSQAQPVDAMWSGFVTACNVKPVNSNEGRAWFALWEEGRVVADYSTGQCRDLFNQIVAAGEQVKSSMEAAETVVRKTLTPGEIRDIRKMNLMDWDGWTLPPPQRRDP